MTAQQPSGSALLRLVDTAVGPASVGRYALIGISGVALDMLLFFVLVRLDVDPLLATTISTLAGIVNNYILNATFNFKTGLGGGSAVRFLLVGLLGLVVAAASLQLLIDYAGFAPLTAKLVSLPCVLAAQFLANKYWSFKA